MAGLSRFKQQKGKSMRILHHAKVGAVFIDWFAKDSRVMLDRPKGGKANWRAWYLWRFRFMVCKAAPHWSTMSPGRSVS
jgi:hypothetical protein